MDEYAELLNTSFSSIVKKYNRLQLSEHSNSSFEEGKEMIEKGIKFMNIIKSHLKTIETLLSDCQDFVKEIEDDLSQKPRKEDFVYQTMHGMLSYPGRDFIKKSEQQKSIRTGNTQTAVDQTEKEESKANEKINIPEIGYNIKLHVTNSLKTIHPMFSYYKGDAIYKAGVYCCLLPGIYLHVPFPEVIDSTKEFDRGHSIRCKYKIRSVCDEQRSKMAKYHKSQVRTCNFSHKGENIVKIGYPSRCNTIPNFGNPKTLLSDVKNINIEDIKHILMYGLNDLFTAAVWLDYTKSGATVFASLEKA